MKPQGCSFQGAVACTEQGLSSHHAPQGVMAQAARATSLPVAWRRLLAAALREWGGGSERIESSGKHIGRRTGRLANKATSPATVKRLPALQINGSPPSPTSPHRSQRAAQWHHRRHCAAHRWQPKFMPFAPSSQRGPAAAPPAQPRRAPPPPPPCTASLPTPCAAACRLRGGGGASGRQGPRSWKGAGVARLVSSPSPRPPLPRPPFTKCSNR